MSAYTDRKELIAKVMQLTELTNDEKSHLVKSLNEEKRYGLVWEEKHEDVETRLAENIPVLQEVKERAIQSDSADAPNHVLIEGDNLEALTALSYTHKGKIDVIYIDPPYNTENKDFLYNDSYVDKDDSFRHSKWLSFMNRRLILAKELLADNGMLFISIDDNEQSQLKILCDGIFSSSNFINLISVKAKSSAGASGGGEDKKLKKNIEYILFYVKNRELSKVVFPVQKQLLYEYIIEKKEAKTSWLYTNIMYKEGTLKLVGVTPAGNGEDIEVYQVNDFEIKSVNEVMIKENLSEEQVYNKYFDKIFTTENAQTSIRQRVRDFVGEDDNYYIARYSPISGRNKGVEIDVGFIGATKRLISFLKNTCVVDNGRAYKLIKIGTLWDDLSWSSISNEGGVAFPAGKKPIALIERLISMHPKDDAVVLDFFAGSASTSHAVMRLNDKDGGCRQAICITANEKNICEEKAYVRIHNVINGYGKNEGLKKNNLRYYKMDYVPQENISVNMRELMEKATDMLCIKHDIYTEVPLCDKPIRKSVLRYFEEGDKRMLMIYEEEYVEEIVKVLATKPVGTKPIMTYVFSSTNYAYDEDFSDVSDRVELCALPKAIYNSYKHVKDVLKIEKIEAEDSESADESTEEGGEA